MAGLCGQRCVKVWVEEFNLTNKKFDDPAIDWGYTVTLNDGDPIAIMRRKDRDKYLAFQGVVTFAPEHLAIFQKLSPAQQQRLADRLAMQLAQRGMTFTFTLSQSSPGFAVSTRVPITPTLTEDEVMQKLDQVDDAMISGRVVIRQFLEDIAAVVKQP